MNTRDCLQQASDLLADAGCDSPRLDAELLLMHAWKVSKTDLIIRMHDQLPAPVRKNFDMLLGRRLKREPVAYILGEKEFWSRSFHVDPRVLIPRPETEHVIEEMLKLYPDCNTPYRFCDIGTGSGCIACTLAVEYPNAELIATDISNDSLDVARMNAARLKLEKRITFRVGDMLSALGNDTGPFDAIVSNPPYVSRKEMEGLEPELAYEPRHALTDEGSGDHFLSVLFNECPDWLSEGGYLVVETGLCGLPHPPPHLQQIKTYRDLAGNIRGGIYRYQP
ncbi:MAG: peptide chain release factor N(5)-glutamine methyltransferase [Mariprofundaceae bacterium]|nr:peptide chain release factor N(5)-glutamine methyltransferase [Mariprofundaceae bacterium]